LEKECGKLTDGLKSRDTSISALNAEKVELVGAASQLQNDLRVAREQLQSANTAAAVSAASAASAIAEKKALNEAASSAASSAATSAAETMKQMEMLRTECVTQQQQNRTLSDSLKDCE